MLVESFLDSNVLVYAFDDAAPAKQAIAKRLISSNTWVCSWQVIQEFASVALHKFEVPMKPEDLSDYLELMLWPRCKMLPSPELFETAIGIHRAFQYQIFDSLVIASALATGASKLLSEDLQDGQKIGTLTIRNPFRSG